MNQQPLTISRITRYAIVVFPIVFAGIPIYIFLPDYYAEQFGISLGTLSIALFILRLFDGFIDPFIGFYSDTWVRWRFWLFPMIFLLFSLGFWILCVPFFSNILANLIIGLFLTTFSFSFLTININAIGALWCEQESSKNRIVIWREGIGLVGILIACILPVSLNRYFPTELAYAIYAAAFIILIVVLGAIFMHWMWRDWSHSRRKAFTASKINIKEYFSNIDSTLYKLFGIYAMSALGSAVPAVMLIFFSKFVLQTSQYTGLYLFLYFLGALMAIPVWQKLIAKTGLVLSWLLGIILSVLIFSVTFFLSVGAVYFFSVICFLSGLCFAVELVAPNVLLAIWVDQKGRQVYANGFYAVMAFISKSAFALATVICLPVLDWQGLSFHGHNSSLMLVVIRVLYALVPCILKLFAAIALVMWWYENRNKIIEDTE